MNIKKVCVIGLGNMGRQISLLCAINGYKTIGYDLFSAQIDAMDSYAKDYLAGRVSKGRLTQQQADDAYSRLSLTDNLENAVADVDIVIEAAVEKMDLKRDLFSKLDKFTKPGTILATNSSYIVSSKLADTLEDPSRLMNMHYFNPALVMKTVEIVQGPHTSPTKAEEAFDFCKTLGKTPVMLFKEIEGFCVNAITTSMLRTAFRMIDDGVVEPKALDTAVKNAMGYPLGPCELVDFGGIDLEYFVWKERYERTGREEDRIPRCLEELYNKGHYGRKTGKGFYDYE